jgi:hypothetical protein
MARYCRNIQVEADPPTAFDYLARFSNAASWDPGVTRAHMVTPEPVTRGTIFEVEVRTMGRDLLFRYEVVEHDAPHRVMLRARRGPLVSEDVITVEPAERGGSIITYDADLRLTGWLRGFDPLLALAFRRIGDRALRGLIDAFSPGRTAAP